jgi:hypothetical protein
MFEAVAEESLGDPLIREEWQAEARRLERECERVTGVVHEIRAARAKQEDK